MAEMSERDPTTLECLARQQDRMLTELASLRDDVNVVSATTLRLDNTIDRRPRPQNMDRVNRRGDCGDPGDP
jgi:hypothetical protein